MWNRAYDGWLTHGSVTLQREDGTVIPLALERWHGGVDAADETVLARCEGPILDVGCGPGRFVRALASRGVPALGLDVAPAALELTRQHGVPALLRDVFAQVPGEGRWPTALLMDGNVGIGGDPTALLRRLGEVISPWGCVVVEIDADPDQDAHARVRLCVDGRPNSAYFAWSSVGLAALARSAGEAAYVVEESWSAGGRTFAVLARRVSFRASRTTRKTYSAVAQAAMMPRSAARFAT